MSASNSQPERQAVSVIFENWPLAISSHLSPLSCDSTYESPLAVHIIKKKKKNPCPNIGIFFFLFFVWFLFCSPLLHYWRPRGLKKKKKKIPIFPGFFFFFFIYGSNGLSYIHLPKVGKIKSKLISLAEKQKGVNDVLVRARRALQWNCVIKRSNIIKPSYNKVIMLIPALYILFLFCTLI